MPQIHADRPLATVFTQDTQDVTRDQALTGQSAIQPAGRTAAPDSVSMGLGESQKGAGHRKLNHGITEFQTL